jgi:hypothetical protein
MKITRWWTYVGIAFVIAMSAFLGAQPDAIPGIGDPRTAEPEARTTRPNASTGAATQPRFEYFPDGYQNQATEPAEPIATF